MRQRPALIAIFIAFMFVGRHHPVDDEPACSQHFDQLGEYALSVTIFYDIEESIRYRLSRTTPWPPVVWQPHPSENTVDLVTEVGPYAVHQLLALNVNKEQTPG